MSTISSSSLISAQNLAQAVRQMSLLSASSSLNNNTSIFSNLGYGYNTSGLSSCGNNNLYQYYQQQSVSNFISKLINYIMMQAFMNYIVQAFSKLFGQQGTQTTSGTQTTCDTQAATADSGKIRDSVQDIINLNKSDEELRNQKGVSYVIACGSGCGRCKAFEPVAKAVNENLGTEATFFSMNPEKAGSLYYSLKKEAGAKNQSYGYPIIIKCVDGKATEFYSYADVKNIYTNKDKMTDWFSSKIS